MATIETRQTRQTVFVDTFTDGVLGPDVPMLGPVADGGHIVVNTTPGCWGPMITPSIRGGHEVCSPVAVEGARVGDAIAIRIRDIEVTSLATSSGNDQPMEGRFNGDPYCAPVCAECGTEWPETRVEGVGQQSVRCANCGADATPFTFTNGYTIAFDPTHTVGVTVGRRGGRGVRARRGAHGRAARQLAPEPDPAVRAARHRRDGDAPAAVHGPARHDAVDHDAGLAQRRRLRLVPGRCAAPLRAHAGRADRAQDRRAHGHRRRAPGRDPRLPGEGRGRRRLPRRHARAAGRRRDRRPHVRRLRHGHARGRGGQGPRDRRPGAVPGARGPAVPRAAAHRGGARARARARAPARRRGARGDGADLGRRHRARTSTRRPTTASPAPPSCSA